MSSQQSLVLKLSLAGMSQVEAGMTRFFGLVKSGSQSIASSTSGLASVGASLGKLFAPLAAAAGAALSVHAVVSGLKDIIKLGGDLSHLADRTGMTVAQLVVLRKAFQMSGIEAENVGKSVGFMQREIANAAINGGPAAAGLERLGLAAEKLLSLSPAEQFRTIAERLGSIENPALRTAIAMDIFGRSGAELLPLFAETGVIAKAEKSLGALPEILGRNAETLHQIDLILEGLPNKSRQLFAGIMDQLATSIKALLDVLQNLNLTRLGQRIGALVNVAIDQWKAGRFSEFIGLSIEAGFELAITAAGKLFERLRDKLGLGSFWSVVGNAFMTTINSVAKVMVTSLAVPVQVVAAGMTKLTDVWLASWKMVAFAIKSEWVDVINFLAAQIERAFSVSALGALGRLLPGGGPHISLGRTTAGPAPNTATVSWSEAWEASGKVMDEQAAKASAWLDQSTQAYRQLAGAEKELTGETNSEGTAVERLNRLIEDQLARRDAEAAALQHHTAAAQANSQALIIQLGARKRLQELEDQAKSRLSVIEERGKLIEGSWSLTDAAKYEARRQALREEAAELQRIVAALRERASLTGLDSPTREQTLARADTYSKQLSDTQGKLAGQGPDPYSTPEQMFATLTSLRNELGTMAQQVGRAFRSVVGSAVDGITNSVKGLLDMTMSWGDALRNIGSSIMTGIINAISRMFAEWIVGRALAGMASIAWSTKEGAVDAAAKAPGAALTSISSWGLAAVVGIAAFVAAMAAFGGFASGGFTGAGSINEPAGLVHRGEFVMPADVVNRLGVPTMEAIRSGAAPSDLGNAGQSSGGRQSSAVNVIMVDNRKEAAEYAASSEFESRIVQIVRKHRIAVGLRS